MESKKSKVLEFIRNKHLMVISSTTVNNFSQSALVAFSENNELEIIFGTFCTTRKYKNIKHQSKVSLVIGWNEEKKITVQYEGKAHELEGEEMTSSPP